MADSHQTPSRRVFLGNSSQLAAAAVAAQLPAKGTEANSSLPNALPEVPSAVLIDTDGTGFRTAQRGGGRYTDRRVAVALKQTQAGQDVRVLCEAQQPLSRVLIRWNLRLPQDTLYLGDAWERSYGDLQWRYLQPERNMPWYFAAHRLGADTFLAGVKTGPSALCFWTVDGDGISLWLDFRNGGGPSLPGDRVIAAATIVTLHVQSPQTPMAALRTFCSLLCPTPRLPATPICGNNNWYYAYGRDFDANAMLRDARLLADLAAGEQVRPYCVIDAGWTPGSAAPGGPWTKGDPQRFPDMPGLAESMRRLQVRPGIWIRPTALMTVDDPRRLRSGPAHSAEKPLDLTMPENLASIHDDVARVRGWGYELIKHDFSTYDVFGRWGPDMGAEMTDPGWHFADRTLTNAEIILRLYRTLRTAAGDAILIGCNTMGHLGAGFFEVQRTGDDTSGREWERTRRMGVNTLAFRFPQHKTFFIVDPDCAAHTAHTPWDLDRQFLDLAARSGAAFFISADPRTITPDQKAVFQKAMQTALRGTPPAAVEPLDWLYTTSPTQWRFGSDHVDYDWQPAAGVEARRV